MQSTPVNEADSAAALKFFDWGYKNGQKMAADLDYVPMPDNVVALIEKSWKEKIKGAGSKFLAFNEARKRRPVAPFPFCLVLS